MATIIPNIPPEKARPASLPRSSGGAHRLNNADGAGIAMPDIKPIVARKATTPHIPSRVDSGVKIDKSEVPPTPIPYKTTGLWSELVIHTLDKYTGKIKLISNYFYIYRPTNHQQLE